MKKWLFNSVVAIIFAASPAAAAELTAPIHFTGTYQFTLAGIPFGNADITFSQDAQRYDATAKVHSTGIARIFVQHDSLTTSKGSGDHFYYTDVAYESDYATRKKKKYVKMIRKNNEIVEEIITPPDNRSVRPTVAAELKNKAIDPLLFGLAIRTAYTKSLTEQRSDFTLSYYDGRRLTQVDFTIGGTKLIKIKGKKYETTLLTARRKPIAGFTANELEKIAPDDPSLLIYLSKDERLILLKLEVPLIFGTATATLVP